MLLKVKNILDTVAPSTYLTQQEAVGAGTLRVQNANGFTAQWAIQIGKTNEEQSEIVLLGTATPSGTSLVSASGAIFSHPTDTPVYAIKYDQIIVKRSTSGTSGSASTLANVSITPDSEFTIYDDTTGATTYAYKTAYFNSALATASSDSGWITSAGYDFYSLASMRQRVKDKLFSSSFIGNDTVINDWINEYLEMMTNAAIDVNEDYNMGSTNVAYSGTAELGTITAADFKQVRRAWHVDGGGTYPMTKMALTAPRPGQIFNVTNPYFFMFGDTVLSRWPHDADGTVSILYYKLNPVLSNDTDLLPQSMRGYTKGFVDYAIAQAYMKDNKPTEGQSKENQAFGLVEKFKKEATPRTKTGPTYMDINESVSEDTGEGMYRQ